MSEDLSFADAFEKGMGLIKGIRGEYLAYNDKDQPTAACAIGTVIIGYLGKNEETVRQYMRVYNNTTLINHLTGAKSVIAFPNSESSGEAIAVIEHMFEGWLPCTRKYSRPEILRYLRQQGL